MQSANVLTILIMAGVALAGCVASDEPAAPAASTGQAPDAEPASFTDETGAILGRVLDDEGLPLGGAQVALVELEILTVSDSGGVFTFSEVDPGSHSLAVNQLGYESVARRVTVVPGEIVEVEFSLTQIPIAQPHHLTQIGDGTLGCGVAFYPGVPTTGAQGLPPWITGVAVCGLPGVSTAVGDKFLQRFDLAEETMELTVEMDWESSQILGSGMRLIVEHDGRPNDDDATFGEADGQSPVRVNANESKMLAVEETSSNTCYDSSCRIQTRIFSSANTTELYIQDLGELPVLGDNPDKVDLGFTVGQRVTQYVTTFHHQVMPPTFSARADA